MKLAVAEQALFEKKITITRQVEETNGIWLHDVVTTLAILTSISWGWNKLIAAGISEQLWATLFLKTGGGQARCFYRKTSQNISGSTLADSFVFPSLPTIEGLKSKKLPPWRTLNLMQWKKLKQLDPAQDYLSQVAEDKSNSWDFVLLMGAGWSLMSCSDDIASLFEGGGGVFGHWRSWLNEIFHIMINEGKKLHSKSAVNKSCFEREDSRIRDCWKILNSAWAFCFHTRMPMQTIQHFWGNENISQTFCC